MSEPNRPTRAECKAIIDSRDSRPIDKCLARAYLELLDECESLRKQVAASNGRDERMASGFATQFVEQGKKLDAAAQERDDLRSENDSLRKDKDRHGFYVASRASIPNRGRMWRDLRRSGLPVNSSWIDEDREGQTESFADLWLRIESEIKRSEALILYAETEDFPLKGAYIEVGIALGSGIPVKVVLPGVHLESRSSRPIGSWIAHPLVTQYATLGEAIDAARESR